MKKITTQIVSLVFAIGIGIATQSCNNEDKKYKFEFSTTQEFADHLQKYADSIKYFNEKWGSEYKKITSSEHPNYSELRNIRSEYESYIQRAKKDIESTKDIGKYSKELRAVYVEFLNVQKSNIETFLAKFEELEGSDSTKKKKLFETIETEGYLSQMAETDAMYQIINFKKLYYKENNLEIKKSTPSEINTNDSIKN